MSLILAACFFFVGVSRVSAMLGSCVDDGLETRQTDNQVHVSLRQVFQPIYLQELTYKMDNKDV